VVRETALRCKHEAEINYLKFGLYLIKLQEMKAHEDLGFGSFSEFCVAPEASGGMGIEARERQQCMQLSRVYLLDLNIPLERLTGIPKTNLVVGVSVVNADNVDQVLSDAETLTKADMTRQKASGIYTGETPPIKPDDDACPDTHFRLWLTGEEVERIRRVLEKAEMYAPDEELLEVLTMLLEKL